MRNRGSVFLAGAGTHTRSGVFYKTQSSGTFTAEKPGR
jgi:hypothetical protein